MPFLFWNLKKLPLQARIAELALEYQVAVIVLVECTIDPAKVLAALNATGMMGFTCPSGPAGAVGGINVFVRFPASALLPVYDDPNNHVTIRRLIPNRSPDLLLVVAHLQSKLKWTGNEQAQGAVRLARKIDDAEKCYNHRRTLLVGDLNMNPFEDGVVSSEGLHGVMTKQTAIRGSRTVDGEDRPFFYNPMWRFFGERPDGPPGTHYYATGGKPIALYWNMFDQVLVRPDLMDALREVKIVDRIGHQSLLGADGQPDVSVGSDHLPLLFVLDW
jgi:hypothetical protein